MSSDEGEFNENEAVRRVKQQEPSRRLLIRGVPEDCDGSQLAKFLSVNLLTQAGFGAIAHDSSAAQPCMEAGVLPSVAMAAFFTAEATTLAVQLDGILCGDSQLRMSRPADYDHRLSCGPLASYTLSDILSTAGALTRKCEENDRISRERDHLLDAEAQLKARTDRILQLLPVAEVPDACPKDDDQNPAYWGLRMIDLLKFHGRIKEDMDAYCEAHDKRKDSYLIVDRYVKPETRKAGKSYAVMINQGRPLLGATFVSHAWGQDFNDLVDTLDTALDTSEVIWMASFALNQHRDLHCHGEQTLQLCPFARALRQARQVIVIASNNVSFTERLWCCSELHLAKAWRIPCVLWPSSNADLQTVKTDIQSLYTKNAAVSSDVDFDSINDMLEEHGGHRKVSYNLRTFLMERLNVFKAAITKMREERLAQEGLSSSKDIFRLRQNVLALERDVARRDPTLRGDHEFGDVSGALFEYPSMVLIVRDPELMRDVFKLNGVCSLKCSGTVMLPEGAWRVGFAVRVDDTLNLDAEVCLLVNRQEKRRLTLDAEVSTDAGWVVLEVAELVGTGHEVEVTMVDVDFEAPAQPTPKFGLYIDRVVARRVIAGVEDPPGGGTAPSLSPQAGLRDTAMSFSSSKSRPTSSAGSGGERSYWPIRS